METIESLEIMQNRSQLWKKQGERIALVPTMGCLHAGHLSLMRKAREHADKVIVSIFVNPTQFGPNEDFEKYPRQLQEDSAVTEQEGVDILFCPSALEMYPKGYQTTVSVKYLTQGLCGAGRPGHFDGVATVVSKLFNITLPDVAVFGQKDFQQLAVIKQMVGDLNLPITIIGAPIVRETDGLALSSRNKYLKGEMRQQALCLRKALISAQKMVRESREKVAATKITQLAQKIVNEHGGTIEYAEIINEATLQREEFITSESVMAIAVKIAGTVRLIDNEKLMSDEHVTSCNLQ